MVKPVSLVVFLVFVVCLKLSSKDISVADYGVNPWSFENASPMIVKAIEHAKEKNCNVINFPEGRIDLWPEGAEKRELYISNTTEPDTLSKVKNIALCIEGFMCKINRKPGCKK